MAIPPSSSPPVKDFLEKEEEGKKIPPKGKWKVIFSQAPSSLFSLPFFGRKYSRGEGGQLGSGFCKA